MQVSVESTGALARRMTVQVPAERISKEVETRLKKVGKTARLDGFRKGKIPFSVIRKRFGDQIHREVLGDVIQSTYVEALREQELNPAGQPAIDPASTEPGKDLEYTATFEVYPEIKDPKVDGLEIERISAEVGDEDLDKMIETLRRQRADWVDVERKAADGDRVTIDFIGSIDGEEFEGGKADDYPVTIGAGQLLADLEKGLIGLIVEDKKDIEVAFPDDYHADELKGKTALFAVTAKKIEEQELPELNEEFVKNFGMEAGDLDAFRSQVRDNMTRELADRIRNDLHKKVMDALWAANTIDLPQALIDQEVQYLREDSVRRMGIEDMSHLPPPEPFQDDATRRVGLGLLLNAVISGEKLTVDAEKLEVKLSGIASSYEKPEEIIKQYRSKQNLMQQLEMAVLEEQVVELLMDKGAVTDKKIKFDDLMGHQHDH